VFMYIVLGLGFLFVMMLFALKFLRKRRQKAIREFEMTNPEYLELQDEHDRIINERASMQTDHPYQKLILAKLRKKKAAENDDEIAINRNDAMIQSILVQYETDEEQLANAYQAQLDAMNRRLAEIELKQRQLRLMASKSAFSVKKIFEEEDV
ncbi:MAG: hypothetical protein ACP5G4_08250, partial [bacterium]